MRRNVVIVGVVLALVVVPAAWAQRSGQSASISVGVVKKSEPIDLQSKAAPAGALVGGMLAYHTTGGNRSSTTKWGRAAAGAVVGGAVARAAEGDLTGMLYTIDVGGGKILQVVSDQREIRVGDCVFVEQVKDQANVRRADPTACEPASAAVLASDEIRHEMQEEAVECTAAKEALLAAETQEQFEFAKRKMDLLCNL